MTKPRRVVYLGLRARRALQRTRGARRRQLLDALGALETSTPDAASLEAEIEAGIVPLPGRSPWLRMTVGDRFVLLRPYERGYLAAGVGAWKAFRVEPRDYTILVTLRGREVEPEEPQQLNIRDLLLDQRDAAKWALVGTALQFVSIALALFANR